MLAKQQEDNLEETLQDNDVPGPVVNEHGPPVILYLSLYFAFLLRLIKKKEEKNSMNTCTVFMSPSGYFLCGFLQISEDRALCTSEHSDISPLTGGQWKKA